MNDPNKIILHHSLTEDNKLLSSYEAIKRYHMEVNGWSDIGYHAVIEYVDNVLTFREGRSWQASGAHCIGQNNESLGWCIVGNYDEDYLTEEHIEFILLKQKEWETKLNRKLPLDMHRNYSGYKSCPGANVSLELFKSVPDDLSGWAYDAWEWVTLNGISDGEDPKRPATREEVWTLLYRYGKIN